MVTSIQLALERVAKNPEPSTDDALSQPVHELVCRALFQIANSPNAKVRGSVRRATRAQEIIMNRMQGRRRAGTHPATRRKAVAVNFADLTGDSA